jgi:hypothetical protein
MKNIYFSMLAASLMGALQQTASAVTIHWGNSLLATMLKSDGTPVTASDGFQFQLGVFESGFVPTTANTATWVANWRPLDSADYNGTARYFTSSFEMILTSGGSAAVSTSPESSGYQVTLGTKIYLMAFNNTAMNETTELFLGSAESWTQGPPSNSQLDKPIDYRLSGITQPIFGGANNTPGGGEKTTPSGPYNFQSATFIPEPSSILLSLLGPGLLLGRRRRS